MRQAFVITFAIALVLWPGAAAGAGLVVACILLR